MSSGKFSSLWKAAVNRLKSSWRRPRRTRSKTYTCSLEQLEDRILLAQLTVGFTLATSTGSEATRSGTVAVALSNPSAKTINVDYAVSGGTVTPGVDFALPNNTLTFLPGQTSKTIPFTVVNDTRNEPDETFQVTLSNPVNAFLGPIASHTHTITDNDPLPRVAFKVAASSGPDSASPATLVVALSTASGQTVTVPYHVSGGTATGGGVDYSLADGVLTFAPGQVTQYIALTVVPDAGNDPNETVQVTLGTAVNAVLGTNVTDTFTILEPHPAVVATPSVSFKVASSSGKEGATPAALAVVLSGAASQAVTVQYAVTGGSASAGLDFTLAPGTLTFAPGETLKYIPLSVADDGLSEANETVQVTLSGPSANARLGTTTVHTYTIMDNDAAPQVSFALARSAGMEGATAQLEVQLSAASGQTVTVNYAVAGGTARSGQDYTLARGRLTFTPGQTSQFVTLPVLDDTLDEPDATVLVKLSRPAHAVLGNLTLHTFTIQEAAPFGPVLVVQTPLAGGDNDLSVHLVGTATDPSSNIDLIRYALDGGPFVPVTLDVSGNFDQTLASTPLVIGAHTVLLQAVDLAGNLAQTSVAFNALDLTVHFVDPHLEAAVRATLQLNPGQVVSKTNILKLVSLSVDSNQISSLVGLEWATNLQSLSLTPSNFAVAGALTDLSPLAGLNKLQSLTLQDAGLSDGELAPLAQPTLLQTLDLRYNNLTSVAGLESAADLQTLDLYGNPITDLSALAGRPIAVDLQPTGLAQANTIAQVAAAFHELPLGIFQYVVNNIAYQPYAGGMKGAQATLETRAGNDWDQDALLAGLLGQAGVSTRYVSGTIDAAIQAVENWLGVTDPGAAGLVLANAGLHPTSISNTNNQVVSIQFDHTWVEASLVVPGMGQQWVPLDPSWKFKDYRPGVANFLGLVPFDENGYLSQVRRETAYQFYDNQVAQYLAANNPGVSLADVAYDGPIHPQGITALPASLPYSVVGSTTTNLSIPLAMTHRVQLTLKQGSTVLFQQLLVLPQMSLERVTIGYTDPGDGSGNLIPNLLLDGQVVATGTAVPAGSGVVLVLDHFDAGNATTVADRSFTYSRTAGQYIAVGLDANQISSSFLVRQQLDINTNAIAVKDGQAAIPDDQFGAFVALGVLKYFHDTDTAKAMIDGLGHATQTFNMVASGLATCQSTVTFHWEQQIPVIPDGFNVDIGNLFHQSFALDGNTANDAAREHIFLTDGSAQENAVWEAVADTSSISTIKSLQLANVRGIPIFTINSANASTFIPQLTLDAATVAAIQNEVNAGATVTVPRDPTPLNKWNGVGYITHSASNDGYIIFGGLQSSAVTAFAGGSGTGDPDDPPLVPVCYICRVSAQGPAPFTDEPVTIANGNVMWDATDINLPGIGLPLAFSRHYNSQTTTDAGLGSGWVYSYDDFLTFNNDGSIVWTNLVGDQHQFTPNGSGGFTGAAELAGSFTGSAQAGYTFRYNDGHTYTFSPAGRLTAMGDPNGNTLTMTYDGNGHLATVTEADAPERQLTFTWTAGHITAVTDYTGRTWSYGYSGTQLVQVTAPSDAQTPVAVTHYDYYTDTARAGLLRQITQPDGGTRQFTYYPNRRALQEIDPAGFAQTFVFNLFRMETSVLDQRGFPTIYRYDNNGQMVRIVHPDQTFESFVWGNGTLTSKTDAFGRMETYQYDARNNMTQKVDRAGILTQYTYDPVFSNVTSITHPGGRVTHFSYDANGNLTQIQDALGNVTTYSYDVHGLLMSQTDPNGNLTGAAPGTFTTIFTYNDAGQVKTQTTDLPSSESWTYDARGNTASHTDANNNKTTYQYDLVDRLLVTTDPLLHARSITYDVMGNMTSTTDELGRTTQYAYDKLERLVTTTYTDHTVMVLAYDPSRNLAVSTDELGRATQFVHDGRNRLVVTLFADGTSTQRFYDGGGRLVEARDQRGNSTQLFYDAAGRLTKTQDALNNNQLFHYDLDGNNDSTTDRRGAVTNFTYDLLDRVSQVRGPEGFVTTTDYDANGNIVNSTRYDVTGLGTIPADPRTLPANLQRPTATAYDVLNRPILVTDPLNQQVHLAYDAGGRITQITDKLGRITKFTYDVLNRLETVTDALLGVVKATYDDVGNVLSATDQNLHVTHYAYDSRNRLTATVDARTGVRTTVYDAVGNIVAVTDQLGRTTQFAYDSLDRRTSTTDALGGQVHFSFDAAGNMTQVKDQLGRSTFYAYDALDRKSQMTAADNGVTAYTYDAEGNLIGVTDPRNHTTQFSYDLRGRQTGTMDAKGGTTVTVYDALDNVTSFQDEMQRLTSYQYDRLNRRTQTTDPLLHPISYQYDAMNNLRFVTDALGHLTEYRYDDLDRRTQAIDANGHATVYAYDGVGNLTGVTDADGNQTNYTYDELNRLKSDTNALNASRTYAYDAVGNRIAETDRDGRKRAFAFDALNRETEERWLDSHGNSVNNIVYVYDAASQLTAAHDPNSGYQYTYDLVGRVSSVDNGLTPGVPDVTLFYTYDKAGNLLTRTDQIGTVLNSQNVYSYDELNRMTSVTQNVAGTINKRVDLGFNAASQLKDVTRYSDPAGTQLVAASSYAYDGAGRLMELKHFAGSTIFAQYDYGYDAANRITSIVSASDGTSNFSYDVTNQLTGAVHSSQANENYGYDKNGNRTNTGYQTDLNNQLKSDGTYNYEYDAEGNRTKRTTIATGEVTTYAWDYRNRLTQVVVKDAIGNIVTNIQYTYDVFDKRIAKSVASGAAAPVVDRFVSDGHNLAFQFDGAGNMTHRYLFGLALDQVFADEDALGKILWSLPDHEGTVRDLVDSTGALKDHINYDSFGRITAETNAAVDHLFAYTGRELDRETGLYYYRARYYDAATGRFLSTDPLPARMADPLTQNAYEYARNDPLRFTDPTGLAPLTFPVDSAEALLAQRAGQTPMNAFRGLFKDFETTLLQLSSAKQTVAEGREPIYSIDYLNQQLNQLYKAVNQQKQILADLPPELRDQLPPPPPPTPEEVALAEARGAQTQAINVNRAPKPGDTQTNALPPAEVVPCDAAPVKPYVYGKGGQGLSSFVKPDPSLLERFWTWAPKGRLGAAVQGLGYGLLGYGLYRAYNDTAAAPEEQKAHVAASGFGGLAGAVTLPFVVVLFTGPIGLLPAIGLGLLGGLGGSAVGGAVVPDPQAPPDQTPPPPPRENVGHNF